MTLKIKLKSSVPALYKHIIPGGNCGDRCFAAAGPKLWNSLPTELRQADFNFQRFKWLLKTFLFWCWDRGVLWLTVKAVPQKFSYLLTFTMHSRNSRHTPGVYSAVYKGILKAEMVVLRWLVEERSAEPSDWHQMTSTSDWDSVPYCREEDVQPCCLHQPTDCQWLLLTDNKRMALHYCLYHSFNGTSAAPGVTRWVDSERHISTIRLYSAIHDDSHWKIQDRRQIKNTDHRKLNTTLKSKCKTQQNKTTLVQSPPTTLGQETRWAYSTMLPSPHEGWVLATVLLTWVDLWTTDNSVSQCWKWQLKTLTYDKLFLRNPTHLDENGMSLRRVNIHSEDGISQRQNIKIII